MSPQPPPSQHMPDVAVVLGKHSGTSLGAYCHLLARMFTAGDYEPGLGQILLKEAPALAAFRAQRRQAPDSFLAPGGGQMLLLSGKTSVLKCCEQVESVS